VESVPAVVAGVFLAAVEIGPVVVVVAFPEVAGFVLVVVG